MGQTQSEVVEEIPIPSMMNHEEPENEEAPQENPAADSTDVFSLYPGFEKQLEISFSTLDVDQEGSLPYSILEPALRHHLMQIGLLEYISRFANPDGSLNFAEVEPYLENYKLTMSSNYSVHEWKYFVLAWIRRVEKAKQDDILTWQETMRELHEKQSEEIQIALREFERRYLLQLEAYYREVDAVVTKEEATRKEWERNLELQEEFYKSQMKILQSKNESALDEYNRQTQHSTSVFDEYIKQLNIGMRTSAGRNVNVVTFCYPSTLTETGAPISCGAPMPYRKRRYRF